jgi:hypothetical protein
MRGAEVGAIAELEDRRDQVHDHGGEELHRVMELGPLQVADEETEIERARKDDKKTEDDFFEVHGELRLKVTMVYETTVAP